MTANLLKQLLTSIHLYYDLGSASLRARAIGEIIAKVLFVKNGRGLIFEEIAEEVARLVEVKKMPKDDILEGLEFLKDKEAVIWQESIDRWFLTNKAIEQIGNDLRNSQLRTKKILESYFSRKIDYKRLVEWFRSACADFFGAYGEIWVKTIYCKKIVELPARSFLEKILSHSIKKCGLESYSKELLTGFRQFLLSSNEQINTAQIWSYAQAMLSAKLVVAGVGPDPMAINKFRGGQLFFDTNMLFGIVLREDPNDKRFFGIAESLKDIGVTLRITKRTKEEYDTVVKREREKLIKLLKILPKKTFREIMKDSRDQFALVAIERDYDTVRDYKAFFEEIKNPPTRMGNLKIKMEDNPEINRVAKESENYTERQREVEKEWLKYYSWPKRKSSINHDVALDAVVDFLRKSNPKTWILTADRSMQSLSRRWSITYFPAWLSLGTMIQLLAIYDTGPKYDPYNFAPLLSKLIEAEIQVTEDLYMVEDVIELIDIEERSKELSKEEIKALANKIARARMLGKSRYDRELALDIKRVLQRKKIIKEEQIQQMEQRTVNLEEELTQEHKKKNTFFVALVKKLASKKRQQERIKYILIFILLSIVGVLIMLLGFYLWKKKGDINIGIMCLGLGLTEIILPTLKWIFPKYKEIGRKAEEWARDQALHLANREKKQD